ncbi:MAG: hypothetical protein AAF498_08730 [Pseudomonadota bacterium]
MPLEIVPYGREHEGMVQRFNDRMAAAGSRWRFYDSHRVDWVSKDGVADASVWRDYYVAVEDGAEVRGGYCLKHQKFRLFGENVWLASWQGPVSEGLVDRRYSRVAVMFFMHMERLQSNLYVWGGSEKLLGFLKNAEWHLTGTSVYLFVRNARPFARNFRPLRTSGRKRAALDMAAATGLADLGASAYRLIHQRRAAEFERISAFGIWADDIWAMATAQYDMVAFRDAASLNHLMAGDGWPEVVLIKVLSGGQPVGWAALKISKMEDDQRFGDMTVGSLVDCLALPGKEEMVVSAAVELLCDQGSDVIMTNVTHPVWDKALKRCGFFASKNRRTFGVSPSFGIKAGTGLVAGAHFTPIDGDGPRGL